MSLSKVLCVAVAGCMLVGSPVLAGPPENTTQPPATATAAHAKAHHKHHKTVAKGNTAHKKLHGKHHAKHQAKPQSPAGTQ